MLMTYCIDKRESYEAIKTKWMARTEQHLSSENIVSFLVGNKLDQQDSREV